MSNLLLAINVILPLFLHMMLGYGLRRLHVVEGEGQKTLNRISFLVLQPVLLFYNIYTTELTQAFHPGLIAFACGGVLLMFLAAMLIVPRLEKQNPRRGVIIHSLFRTNFALFGLPLALSLCGEGRVGPTSLLIGITIPFYSILGVIALETFRGGKPNLRNVVKGIVKNPLIIASVLGIGINLLGLRFPTPVEKAVGDVAKAATPLALMVLGSEFAFGRLRSFWKPVSAVVCCKLLLVPLLMVSVAVALGFRQEYLVPLLILFGGPTAVSTHAMARQMGGDSELAAALVMFTSLFSIVTMCLWVFVLKQGMFI